jgi:hypothetical protein
MGLTSEPPANAAMSVTEAAQSARAGAARAEGRWLDPLLSTRGVIAFWLLYAVVHIALRLSASDSLSIDDARASEVAQNFALGYQVRQPPLYEWLLWSMQQLLGVGAASFIVLRFMLIAAIGIATFTATRAITGEPRWSAAASLSLALTYTVGWNFQEASAHSLLLSIGCLLTLQTAVDFIHRPSIATATFLGLAIGLGLMSKFSYPLLLAGLLLAVASLPEMRGRLADRRLLLSCAVAFACTAPYLYWLAEIRGDLVAMTTAHLVKSTEPYIVRVLIGLAKLAWSVPAFLMPWLALVAVLAWPAFRRTQGVPPASVAERIALRAMVFALLLSAIGIVILGATNIAERYMHVILMTAPAYVFARIARTAPDTRSLNLIVHTSLIFTVAILALRLFSFFENDLTRRTLRGFAVPYDGLAAALIERGITEGTLIAPDVREAGNMRVQIPALRVLGGDSLRLERLPRRASDARSCVLIWREYEMAEARTYAPNAVDSAERIEVVTTSVWGIRRGIWFFARLDPRSQACS